MTVALHHVAGSVKNWRWMALLAFLYCVPMPSFAAAESTDSIDCAYDGINPELRLSLGDYLLATVSKDSGIAKPKDAFAALQRQMARCVEDNEWTENESAAAFAYTNAKLLADVAKYYVVQMGGDDAAADLFFAQNKYRILDESKQGLSSEDWANTRLLEMGFAPKKSRAFEVVWLYFGMLFQMDDARDSFATNSKSGWTD